MNININGTYPMNDAELFENITILPPEAVERIRKTSQAQLRAARKWREERREDYIASQKRYNDNHKEEKNEYVKNYYHNVVKPRLAEQKRLAKLAKEVGNV